MHAKDSSKLNVVFWCYSKYARWQGSKISKFPWYDNLHFVNMYCVCNEQHILQRLCWIKSSYLDQIVSIKTELLAQWKKTHLLSSVLFRWLFIINISIQTEMFLVKHFSSRWKTIYPKYTLLDDNSLILEGFFHKVTQKNLQTSGNIIKV